MTSPSSPAPTPLELLDNLRPLMTIAPGRSRSFQELAAFLSSPAIQALSDPALRAAAEVVIARLPELMPRFGAWAKGGRRAPSYDKLKTEIFNLIYDAHEAAQAAKGEGA